MVATAPLLLVHASPVPVTVTGVEDPVVAPFPSWPKSLPGPTAPQHFTVPSARSAQLCKTPELTATAPVMPPTRTGVDELVVVPSPSCPSRFRPQHCTVPSARSAQVCWNPPLTAVALGSPATRPGTREPLVDPLPSCPSAFRPQHHTVPSPRCAQRWYPLGAAATAPVSRPTAAGGVEVLLKVPSPRCPESPTPQHCTVPSPRSAHVWASPVTTRVAVVRPLTATGTEELLKLPSPLPSCPKLFRPQHCTVPSGSRIHVCNPPAARAVGATVPLAVNCCVWPTLMVGFAGVTVMPCAATSPLGPAH